MASPIGKERDKLKTDNNEIQYSDYIKPDEIEELAGRNSKDKLSELQEQNRGISYMICQAKPTILKTPFFQTDFARTIVRKNGAFFKNRGDFSHRYPPVFAHFPQNGRTFPYAAANSFLRDNMYF